MLCGFGTLAFTAAVGGGEVAVWARGPAAPHIWTEHDSDAPSPPAPIWSHSLNFEAELFMQVPSEEKAILTAAVNCWRKLLKECRKRFAQFLVLIAFVGLNSE